MVSKKILGVAIAAAMFSGSAFAEIDTTVSPIAGALTVAKEAVLKAQVSDGTTVDAGLINLTSAGTQLNLKVKAGAGVASGGHGYVRINLTNAKFAGAVPALTTTGTAFTAQNITQGGTANSSYVIIDLTSAGIAQSDVFTLPLTALAVSSSAPVSISYALYDTPSAAVNQTAANVLASTSYPSAVTVTEVLKQTFTASNLTADVSASPAFTKFDTNSATGVIGKFKFELASGATDATGTAVTTLAQVIDVTDGKSALTLTGDLSFTVADTAANTAANLTFGAQASNTASTNVPSAKTDKFTTAGYALATDYNVSITAKSVINQGSYTLASSLVGITNAQFGPTNKSASVGTISYNGTTIQVPYVTTLADYNQRLVLVNRGSSAVPYSVTFTPEAGVTATAGASASGTLAAKQTKVIKAADLVTVTGATRTAATVVITAPSSTIDAATTTVNLSDKSTDTVKLQ